VARCVLLCQLDGKLPNLALMRLAGHHKEQGDDVILRQVRSVAAAQRELGDDFARVYASLIFDRSRPIAEALQRAYPGAVLGGTGWDLATTLESLGVPEDTRPDYSLYPAFRQSMGFTQRGCRLKCEFCVVPAKEGAVRPAATIRDIWRGEPHPRELLLLDNDFFGQPDWRRRIAEIRDGAFRVNFTQGINARMISQEAAEAMASVDYFGTNFTHRQLYTAWDNKADEQVLFRGLARLVAAGVSARRITVYMLIGYWAGETDEDWEYRRRRLRDFGCDPYPMPYHRTALAVGFQRFCVGHYDRRISWADWKAVRCEPRRLMPPGRTTLPLFDNLCLE
jgi:hypothetical protein